MFQSIRSSCERCRSQKLKCALPDGSNGQGPCQRCSRAKVECAFSRRRRASRGDPDKPNKRVNSTATTATTPDTNTNPMLASPVTPVTMTDLACLTMPSPEVETIVESATYDVLDWNTFQLQEPSDKTMDLLNDMSSYDQGQHMKDLDNAFLFDTSQLYSSRRSPPKQAYTQAEKALTGACGESNGMVQRLLLLLSQMQHQMSTLKERTWRFGSMCGLNDYPIGTILHLSQEFIAAAQPILGGPNEPFNGNMSTTSSSSESILVDDLATVLVLSGHMSLMRIYSIAFGHFQSHLSRVPSQGHSLGRGSVSPGLQLSELPSANAAHELGRVHMALCMLQGSLKDVDGQLGVGGAVAREMVMAQLRKEGMSTTESFLDGSSGLSKQASSVKELLREKMSL